MHVSRAKLRLIVSATLIGNTLEWYEFYLFVQFAPIFTALFFPTYSRKAAIVGTFLIFGVGFIARPFGTLFFGHIGDRFGRRIALISSILLMTFPTLCIGLLPTYATIGIMAAVLMACLRFLQGVSTGGEFTGAMCYLTEFAAPDKRGIMGSWVFFGSQIGAILSISEFLVLDNFVSEHHLAEWGWRITFIVGGLIGLIGWYLRKKLKETPPFMALQKEGKITTLPIIDTFRHHKIPMIKSFLLCAFLLAGWYLVFIYAPVYSAQILNRDFSEQMLMLLGMIVLSNLCLPIFGILADKGYTKILWSISCFGGILLAYPLFVSHDSFALEVFLRALASILFTIQYSLLPMLICGLFPTHVRYTGVGVSYNFCSVFLGGGAPFFTLILSNVTENYLVPIFFLIITSLLSWGALFWIKDKHQTHQGAYR